MSILELLVVAIFLFCIAIIPASLLVRMKQKSAERKRAKGMVGSKGVLVNGRWISFDEARKRKVKIEDYWDPPKPKKKSYWKVRYQ